MNQLLLMAGEILEKNVSFTIVVKLIIFSLPAIVAIAFPFATLVGALMAVGKLSSDNEILAMECSGISLKRIFLPLVSIGVFFSIFSFIVNDYFLPLGSLQFTRLYKELIYSNPELELESNSIKHYQDSTIITGDISNGIIDNIIIIDRSVENDKRVILAQSGNFRSDAKEEGVISLNLSEVFTHVIETNAKGNFSYSRAGRMIYNILLKDITVSLKNPGPREMSSRDVYTVIREKQIDFNARIVQQKNQVGLARYKLLSSYQEITDHLEDDSFSSKKEILDRNLEKYIRERDKKLEDKSLQIWKLEFYQKMSIPFSCLPFILLAFPLGLFTKRSGKSVGFGIGLLITVIYWVMLIGGRTIGIRTAVSPGLVMWLPNIFIFLIGLILLFRRVRQ
ncbi:lipopolysaccharide export system permease protein [Spirochaeta isovalerica]|uniref:Lipopolysaccharide export system permease protein n=1 Tax=Spirochaeta isovalerica TaxID=150 RepID=A0A841R6Y9_9SPIO|nr:lipopolysaccharide export system permease protein [Spirochaeta isovalerica]